MAKGVINQQVVIVNGLLCSVMQAMTRSPKREILSPAILRDSDELQLKVAWTELFT